MYQWGMRNWGSHWRVPEAREAKGSQDTMGTTLDPTGMTLAEIPNIDVVILSMSFCELFPVFLGMPSAS